MTLAVTQQKADQPNEKRRKAGQNEHSNREGHEVSAEPVKNFRIVGDVKNTPLACERKATLELRGETRGTGQTHRQKRWPTRS